MRCISVAVRSRTGKCELGLGLFEKGNGKRPLNLLAMAMDQPIWQNWESWGYETNEV